MQQPISKRLFAALAAFILLLNLSLPVLAAEKAQGQILHISTVEDLLDLQTLCTVDTATEGLTVLLDADLNLVGSGFSGLPSFSGHFDGQGHRITGLDLPGGSVGGFFRYIEEDAVVENLHLEGSSGSTDALIQGLLVGSNRGTIRTCSTSGSVSASEEAGGIAGRNEATGLILDCTNQASVQANRMAGGIAGQSLGRIAQCRNEGAINTNLQKAANNLIGLNLSDEGADEASIHALSDIGGIAGYASGQLEDCINTGDVGYPSEGYNVGGIAGRLSGSLEGCENSGHVQGCQDIGGVAGQLEPSLTVQRRAGNLDALCDELDALQGQIETALNSLDAERADLDKYSSAWTDLYAALRSFQEAGIPEAMEELETLVEQAAADPARQQWAKELYQALLNCQEARSALQQARGTMEAQLTADSPDWGVVLSAAGAALQSASDLGSAANQMLDSLDAGTAGISPEDLEALRARVAALVQSVETAKPAARQAAAAAAQLQSLPQTSQALLNGTLDSLQSVHAQFDSVLAAAQQLNTEAGETLETLFEDISCQQASLQPQDRKGGSIAASSNSGLIEGDSAVGGIAGSMAIELDTNPAGYWEMSGDETAAGIQVQLSVVLTDCLNTGSVTAKKDEVGGIAGRMDFGYSAGCENYGDITSTGGNYVGGIAGRARGTLKDCWARCVLSGEIFVGGVAGSGSCIQDCRTMVEILSANSRMGAIAGAAEGTDISLSGNLYVGGSWGAVDNITRTSQASPADLDTLMADEAVPDRFAQLELTFIADGEIVAVLPFRYGEGIDSLPAVPQKEGTVGQWPALNYTCLTYSRTIEAEYIPYTTALSDGSDLPQILVGGNFSSEASISTSSVEVRFTDENGREHSGTAWTISVTDPLFAAPDCMVHFRKPDVNARYTVWVQQDGQRVQQSAQTDGSYLLIPCSGGQITFLAEERPFNMVMVVGIAIGAAALLAGCILLGQQRKQRMGKAKTAK